MVSTMMRKALLPPLLFVITDLAAQDYCTPMFGITQPFCQVAFADLDHAEGEIPAHSGAYGEFISDTVHVNAGDTIPITVKSWFQSWAMDSYRYTAFFDWDHDGLFETSVPVGFYLDDTYGCYGVTGTSIVPQDALSGFSRMRIMADQGLWYGYPDPDPCISTYGLKGHVHDYTVHVTAPAQVDCEGEPDGPALPGTPCVGIDGYGGVWNDECECDLNVGMTEDVLRPAGVRIHPNPVQHVLFIDNATSSATGVLIYDLLGNLIIRHPGSSRIDVAMLAQGTYMIVLIGPNEQPIARARFVKQ